MAAEQNMQYTHSAGVSPAIIEYYERALLENMKPEMVYNMDAQKRTLPLNNGRTVQFRRFSPFPAITTPLVEGVTPTGQSLTETAFRATIKGYGGYVEMTDEMNLYMLDDIHAETAKLLADQAALSLDTISRDALMSGLNVQYAGGATARSGLTSAATHKLTYAEIKKAVRTLKRNNVKPCSDGYYHAVVHPDVVHDLTSDAMWVDVAKYQDKQPVSTYELGIIYKVKFFESTNAKVYNASEAHIVGNDTGMTAIDTISVTSYDHATKSAACATTFTADQKNALAGKMVYATVSSTVYPLCIERVADGKIYFRYSYAALDGTQSMTLSKYAHGDNALPVYATIIYGANAYGSVELGGNGRNVETIVKEPGSSGSLDPLNQRGTIAWRVKGFTTVILQDDFIVRVESTASA